MLDDNGEHEDTTRDHAERLTISLLAPSSPEPRNTLSDKERSLRCMHVLYVLVLAMLCTYWGLYLYEQVNFIPDKPRPAIAISYNESLAKELVAYAAAVSCSNRSILESWTCHICQHGVAPIPPPPSLRDILVMQDEVEINQAMVGYDEASKRIVVSFRGSVAAAQWIFDLDITPVHEYCNGCLVHQGFYLSWRDLHDEVMEKVQNLSATYQTYLVYVTGHSLGAAIAVHAGLALAKHGYTITGYTFGQPRVGNEAFATYANHLLPQWIRVVNYHDPVPQCPKLPFLYHHMSTEIYYYEIPKPGASLGPYRMCDPGNGEDSKCQNADCGGFKLCLDGEFHVSYMNLPGLTNETLIC
mmetsp:Transcript_16680/g.32365  ORF Transcript_16680/g.32365 Transcript_16680/m.32365 type:complete len:356 (+) Transcript_16680:311-1378(+)